MHLLTLIVKIIDQAIELREQSVQLQPESKKAKQGFQF